MKKLMFVMALGLFAFQASAMAETIDGKIVSIDAVGHALSLSRVDASTGEEGQVDVAVSDTTVYSGIASLADLKEGQSVSVDAEADAVSGDLSATSVRLSDEVPALAAETSEAPAEEAVM